MNIKKNKIIYIVFAALIAAVSFVSILLIRVPVASFLSYEPKDVIITISGFIFGPLFSVIVSLVVSLVEMITISDTGIIGCIMNFVSSCAFICPATVIYARKKTTKSAIVGLAVGVVFMTSIMILWNYIITPFYLTTTRAEVAAMILPLLLPFNLLKSIFNAGVILFLYKPVIYALGRAKLIPNDERNEKEQTKEGIAVWLVSAAVFTITGIFIFLAIKGII